MTQIKDGGPAFPFVSHGAFNSHQACDQGMTLRDYFAGQALSQLVSQDGWTDYQAFFIADTAYELADAMITAREVKS